jgi:hypothetical protein
MRRLGSIRRPGENQGTDRRNYHRYHYAGNGASSVCPRIIRPRIIHVAHLQPKCDYVIVMNVNDHR